MGRPIKKLSATLGMVMKKHGLGDQAGGYRVFVHWDRCVGPAIARHAQPVSVRGRKLTLVVDSPAWLQQLSLLKPELIDKLKTALGSNAIQDITLKLGIVQPPAGEPDRKPLRVSLSPDEHARIEEFVRGVGDEETRAALKRLIEKDFASRKRMS